MNKIILLTFLCFIYLFPQSTINPKKSFDPHSSDTLTPKLERYGNPFIDPTTTYEIDSGAVLIKSDRTVQKFANIKLALQSVDPGSTIMVYPGTYSDSLTISVENVSIIGISPMSVTISGAVYITASRGLIQNCRITGNQTLIGQTIKALYYVKDCLLENNINIGTASTPIISNCYFMDCLLGTDVPWTPKTIYVNVNASGGGAPDIFFHQCFSPVWSNSHNFYLTGGYANVHIEGSTKIAFNSITIAGGADISHTPMLFFNSCNLAIITLTLTGFTEISCINSEVTFFSNTTIANNCEFDMFSCKVNGAAYLDLTFNSTLHSRWTHCTGTTNIAHINGSHLEKLHIQYSFFQQTAAPVGLGSDDANTWGAWVDY